MISWLVEMEKSVSTADLTLGMLWNTSIVNETHPDLTNLDHLSMRYYVSEQVGFVTRQWVLRVRIRIFKTYVPP